MADEQQAQQFTEGQQEAPMPSAEQTESVHEVSEAAPQEVSSQTEESRLPDGVKERTSREFEKLQSQLREERMRREQIEYRLSQSQKEILPPVYDPETGLLNEQGLTALQKQALEADRRAARTEEQLNSFVKNQEEKELFASHPSLNPGSKEYDSKFDTRVAEVYYFSQISPQRYGGKQLSMKEAADLVRGNSQPGLEKAKQQGAKEALEQLTPKEQAALQARGATSQRVGGSDLSDLRFKTRKGDTSATIERLKAIPWSK